MGWGCSLFQEVLAKQAHSSGFEAQDCIDCGRALLTQDSGLDTGRSEVQGELQHLASLKPTWSTTQDLASIIMIIIHWEKAESVSTREQGLYSNKK